MRVVTPDKTTMLSLAMRRLVTTAFVVLVGCTLPHPAPEPDADAGNQCEAHGGYCQVSFYEDCHPGLYAYDSYCGPLVHCCSPFRDGGAMDGE